MRNPPLSGGPDGTALVQLLSVEIMQ